MILKDNDNKSGKVVVNSPSYQFTIQDLNPQYGGDYFNYLIDYISTYLRGYSEDNLSYVKVEILIEYEK